MARQTPAQPRNRGGKSYTVTLNNGNTLTVVVNVNPFELSGPDRAFVFDIVDKVTTYGKKNGAKAKAEADTPEPEASQADAPGGYGL